MLADLRKDADHLGWGLADVSLRWRGGRSACCWPDIFMANHVDLAGR